MSEAITIEKNANSNVVISIVAVVILAIVSLGGFSILSSRNAQNASTNETQQTSQEEKSKATIEILSQDASVKKYEPTFEEGETALEVMQELDDNNEDFAFAFSASDYGAFVVGVNGYTAKSENNEFWKMIVNGEDSQVGISDYKVQNNDVFRWEIDTF